MKPLRWVGGSEKNLKVLPAEVRREIRAALVVAQDGGTSRVARRMHGRLRDAMEVVVHGRDSTFRGIYYIGAEMIYGLHFFQKKSKRGISTPKKELELIYSRLAAARFDERKADQRDELRNGG